MLGLTERKKVEQLQLKFAILLQKYITYRLNVKRSAQSFNIIILQAPFWSLPGPEQVHQGNNGGHQVQGDAHDGEYWLLYIIAK